MKKTITVFVSFIMLLLSSVAFAANIRASGLYTYEIKGNGTITITDFNWSSNSADIFIPNMIDGYMVTGIGKEAFAYGDKQNGTEYTLTLPEGIKSIGDKAFWNANISAINLPSSLQHIGSASFYGCPSCQFKPTPNHPYFAVIGEGLYSKAKKELIAYSWKNEDSTGKDHVIFNIPEGIQSIGPYAIAEINSYRKNEGDLNIDISLPSTLISIGDYAFYSSKWIHKITGNLTNLKIIGEYAFSNCYSHSCDLIMPAVETIGDEAFSGASLHRPFNHGKHSGYCIDFTGSPLKEIGNGAFWHIENESSFTDENVFILPIANCSNIGINNKGLGSIMTEISDFSPELSTIPTGLNPQISALPSTVTAIQSNAFKDEVTNFRLSMSLNDIAVDAFPKGSTFIVDAGSYAELWCSENGFGYTVEGQEDDLSWLN